MISIVIPVYNHNKDLRECLRSIFKQTLKDYEIIVVDDGSEKKIEVLENIKLIRQKHAGANVARNRGFKESRGEFLLFCDADIIMDKECLEKMLECLKNNPEVSYAYCSFKFGWKKFKLWEFDAEKLKKMPYIHTTSLIRREHFPMFDEKIKRLQDWDLFLTMLERGHTGKWIPEFLFSIKTKDGKISNWLPSFLYKIPWLKTIKKFKLAERVIKEKHKLI